MCVWSSILIIDFQLASTVVAFVLALVRSDAGAFTSFPTIVAFDLFVDRIEMRDDTLAPRRYDADMARRITHVAQCMHFCYACSSRADQAQKLSELQGVRALAFSVACLHQCMFFSS